jgi:Pectate lyase superfamily protein/Right handed beta helix region
MLNVRDFGALGDGDTNQKADDTTALQNAFDAVPPSGGVIYVPPGIYVVNKTLALKTKTYLKGAGFGTVFKRQDPKMAGVSTPSIDIIFFSETVADVTVEAISIDINGALPPPNKKSFATCLGFRSGCSNIRIRDTRIFDSTKTNVCCRMGIVVEESDHVWIERNYLTDGLRLKAGGIGDTLIIDNNIVENANDNAITIAQSGGPTKTVNYLIRGNIVKAAKGAFIYIGDDGGNNTTAGLTYQNIVVEGNLLLGPSKNVMLIVRLAYDTERLHIVNNIIVNTGKCPTPEEETAESIYMAGIATSIQTPPPGFGRPGTDFMIANNTVDGPFNLAGIWVQSSYRVRINHNQVTSNICGDGMRITGVNTAIIQGNIIDGCNRGILFRPDLSPFQVRSVQVVIGNSITGSLAQGILLSVASGEPAEVSAQFIGNRVSDNKLAGIEEEGSGVFDTHYLFNDLRNNAVGAFSGINANATRLGNLGTEEYILRHISGTAPWDPPLLGNGSSTSATVNLGGAVVGDTVAVGFNQPIPGGSILSGAVTAADTVTVTLLNMTGGSFDLPQGTVRVDVWRHS